MFRGISIPLTTRFFELQQIIHLLSGCDFGSKKLGNPVFSDPSRNCFHLALYSNCLLGLSVSIESKNSCGSSSFFQYLIFLEPLTNNVCPLIKSLFSFNFPVLQKKHLDSS